MYLSKVLVTGPACHNPYEIHRVLWKLFVPHKCGDEQLCPEKTEASRDFLFRVEKSDSGQAEILMQSMREPVLVHREVRLIACREYGLSLHTGQTLHFLLVANPIKTIDDENDRKNTRGETKKCRVPLVDDGEQRTWLGRKLVQSAYLGSLEVDKKPPLYFRKHKEHLVGKIQPVVYKGTLTVQNPAALQEIVQQGIGPAKAFGCGLLSLAQG